MRNDESSRPIPYLVSVNERVIIPSERNKNANANFVCLSSDLNYLDKPGEKKTNNRSDRDLLPDPCQALVLAKIRGMRIRASDGKLYPKLSTAQRRAAQQATNERRNYHRTSAQIDQLRLALKLLSQCSDPSDLAIHTNNHAELGEQLDFALTWLSRFAEELQHRGKACCS